MRKFIGWSLLSVLLFPGIGLAAGRRVEKNKALVQRVFDEILNKGRYEVFGELYSPDFVKHVDRRDYNLAEETKAAKGMRDAASDLVVTIDLLIAEGDKVAVLYTGRGTNDGPFSGRPATGKKLVSSGTTIYRFSSGKIVEEWTTYNMLEILRQLGYYADPAIK